MRPHGLQPTRLPRPWDSPGKNTGVGCHFLLQCMKVKSESEITQSCLTLATPWTAAYQAPPSMGFSRQKYWSGVPLPSPSPAVRGSLFTSEACEWENWQITFYPYKCFSQKWKTLWRKRLDSMDESSAFLLPLLETQEFSVYLREGWLKFRLRYNHFLQDSCVDTLLFGVFLSVSM